jgi:DNA-binding PadR family transcriptional regulator
MLANLVLCYTQYLIRDKVMESKAQYRKGCVRTVILKMLSERPMYGYEIAQEFARRSENVFALDQGTLCPMVYSLERKKQIAAVKGWHE